MKLIYFTFLLGIAAAAPIPGHPLLSLRPGTWWAAPNSSLQNSSVAPSPENYPNLLVSFRQLVSDSGAALDPSRNLLFITGAGLEQFGSNDNSLYAYDINNLNWTRYWGPGGNFRINRSVDDLILYDQFNNSYPGARDTRDGIEYDPINSEIVTMGGEYYSGGSPTHTWTFDIATKNWTKRMDWPTLTYYSGLFGTMMGFDTVTQKFIASGQYQVQAYDPVSRNITTNLIRFCDGVVGSLGGLWNPGAVANVLPEDRLFHMIGRGRQYLWNITDITSPCLLNVSSASQVRGSPGIIEAHAPGVDMHPALQTLVGYAGDGAGVYVLNKTTMRWKYRPASRDNTVVPATTSVGNIFSRWRYVPDYDVFVLLANHLAPMYFFKLGEAPEELCNEALRPQEPYPDAWDCIDGAWRYLAPLYINPNTSITFVNNATVVGNLGLQGTLVVAPDVTVQVTGCIVIANGSSIDLQLTPLTYDQATTLVGSNITVALSSTGCVQNPNGLSPDLIPVASGSRPCEEVSGVPTVDRTRGALVVLFQTAGNEACLSAAVSNPVPTWAIAIIVIAAALVIGAIAAVVTIPALRRRFVPSYRVRSMLQNIVRDPHFVQK